MIGKMAFAGKEGSLFKTDRENDRVGTRPAQFVSFYRARPA